MKYVWYELDNEPIEEVTLSATVKFGSASVSGSVKITLGTARYELG